ncbi:MAG: hypothetical protein ACKVQS_03135 [Fimbriimonadaceae bacterium]
MSFAFALATFLTLQQNQPATPPAPKPATESAVLKQPYVMGEKGNQLHFTLDSAQVAGYYPAPDDIFIAGENQRLLILTFTVKNPEKKEVSLGSSTFTYSVTSPDDENFEFRGYLLHAKKKSHLSQTLKAQQSVQCSIVLPIYSVGPVSNIQIRRGDDFLLRYNLTGKIPPVDSLFVHQGIDFHKFPRTSPLEPEGTTDMGGYQITFKRVYYTNEPIMTNPPPADHTYMVIEMQFNSLMMRPISLGFQSFSVSLSAMDNGVVAIPWNSTLLEISSDKYLSLNDLQYIVRGRYFFAVPLKNHRYWVDIEETFTKRKIGLRVPNLD